MPSGASRNTARATSRSPKDPVLPGAGRLLQALSDDGRGAPQRSFGKGQPDHAAMLKIFGFLALIAIALVVLSAASMPPKGEVFGPPIPSSIVWNEERCRQVFYHDY